MAKRKNKRGSGRSESGGKPGPKDLGQSPDEAGEPQSGATDHSPSAGGDPKRVTSETPHSAAGVSDFMADEIGALDSMLKREAKRESSKTPGRGDESLSDGEDGGA